MNKSGKSDYIQQRDVNGLEGGIHGLTFIRLLFCIINQDEQYDRRFPAQMNLTFKGFMRGYCRELTGLNTDNLKSSVTLLILTLLRQPRR